MLFVRNTISNSTISNNTIVQSIVRDMIVNIKSLTLIGNKNISSLIIKPPTTIDNTTIDNTIIVLSQVRPS